MAKTVVVFHSGYGHTQRVAQFVAQGANAQSITIDADGNITEADWAALDAADAIIFGSPTYMGMASYYNHRRKCMHTILVVVSKGLLLIGIAYLIGYTVDPNPANAQRECVYAGLCFLGSMAIIRQRRTTFDIPIACMWHLRHNAKCHQLALFS